VTGVTHAVAAQFPPAASGNPMATRTRLLLQAPIAATRLRLAAPDVVMEVLQWRGTPYLLSGQTESPQ
jgi:hypothetical protein